MLSCIYPGRDARPICAPHTGSVNTGAWLTACRQSMLHLLSAARWYEETNTTHLPDNTSDTWVDYDTTGCVVTVSLMLCFMPLVMFRTSLNCPVLVFCVSLWSFSFPLWLFCVISLWFWIIFHVFKDILHLFVDVWCLFTSLWFVWLCGCLSLFCMSLPSPCRCFVSLCGCIVAPEPRSVIHPCFCCTVLLFLSLSLFLSSFTLCFYSYCYSFSF